MNKYYSIHLLLAVMVIGVVILPIAGQAQTNVQEDPTRPSQQPGGTQQPGGAQTGGATDNERARAAEAERKRTTDERRPHRDRGEWYVGGFIGATLGHDFSDVERPGAGVGSTGDIGLSDSVVYGGKLGYFLPDRWNWLGFETEAFNTTPHLEQQGSIPGSNLRVTTWAFNVVARAQMACDDDRSDKSDRSDVGGRSRGTSPERDHRKLCHLQPYVGAGPGVFFANASNGTSSSDNGVVGLNALAGVRYFLTEQMALFGEYKYNSASFEFDNVSGTGPLKGDYSASHLVGGVSFHF